MEDAINLEAKQIVKDTKLDDKIECTTKNPTFPTLKDHKTNFRTSSSCRLLIPCKSELAKIRKLILEKANKYIVDLLSLKLCKYSDMVINWFSSIKISVCIYSTGYHGSLSLSNGNNTRQRIIIYKTTRR